MSSISSITKAVSGLVAAQKGLQVTGHNISNMNTNGYTRQQLLQSESPYLNIGHTATNTMQVGLGVTCDEIRQIRDALADKRLRTEKSVLCYYQTLNSVTQDIESMFDEPYGDTISDFLNDFWSQAQKLSTSPGEVEERMSFISAAKVLIDKINDVSNSLTDYQYHINSNLETSVKRINEITAEIRKLNDKIASAEVNGDHANDYRDQRNLLLDELSEYGQISYYEDESKMVTVKFEGHQVVNRGMEININLEDISKSPFKLPVWSDSNDDVIKDLNEISSPANQNDAGKLKALLIARGNNVANSETKWEDIALNDNFSVDVYGNAYIIPKLQKMLNEFTNKLVKTVNDSFKEGMGIGTWAGKDGVDVFVAIKDNDINRPGNVQVNPKLLENGGHNLLGTVAKGSNADKNKDNKSDNTIVKNFLSKWTSKEKWFENAGTTAPDEKIVDFPTFFTELVTSFGADGKVYNDKTQEKNISITNIENERQSMGGVSMDEEFTYMLKYQYAYNASSRMITMLDSMLDTIVNRM